MELSQNLWQTFDCVASEKKTFPQKMELSQNLWQTFACGIRKKTFPKKMELSQNLWQTFACVASEKKHFSSKNGVVTKFMADVRFF